MPILGFNPYFVGDESGSQPGCTALSAEMQVSILILLEMSLEGSAIRLRT